MLVSDDDDDRIEEMNSTFQAGYPGFQILYSFHSKIIDWILDIISCHVTKISELLGAGIYTQNHSKKLA